MGHTEAMKVSRYQTHTHTHIYMYATHTIHWPGIKESGAQDHDSLTGALFQLHLDGAELTVDDSHHALDLFGGDGPRAGLFPQQVHHMGSEFVTRLPSDGDKNSQSESSKTSLRLIKALWLILSRRSHFSYVKWVHYTQALRALFIYYTDDIIGEVIFEYKCRFAIWLGPNAERI